jgi:hypothetical protein
LAKTDGSAPPCLVSTLRHKYFDLEASTGAHIIHGVFVQIESAIHGPSADVTHMFSKKEAKDILTKIAHCPLAWWYWHWVKKGYTQDTIQNLLNKFKSNAANNAHDSMYDPQMMTLTSMFAGEDENQWLDQDKEEFSSNLSDHEGDNVKGLRTTITLDVDAKESLANEMKENDYDLKGVNSRSSKRTHCTNMTGKTGMTLACLVTTKKFAMNFNQ